MVKYVIQRLIAAFFTFVVILIVVFFVLHSMPGDIIDFSPKTGSGDPGDDHG